MAYDTSLIPNFTTRGAIDSYISGAQQKGYGAGDVNAIANRLSANTAGVSFQELQSRLGSGALPASGGGGDLNGILSQIASLKNSFNSTPVAPYFDIVGNYNKANEQAQAGVNPLYVKKINDFIARQSVEKQRQQADTELQKQQLDKALATTLETSGIERGRTAEDTTNTLSQLADKEQNFQADSGTSFDKARSSLTGSVADSGLTTSGLGGQQLAEQQANRNTDEGRQVKSFNVQKQAAQTLKSRTFEDLGRSDVQSTEKTTEGKKAVQLDLDRYIEDQAYSLKQERQSEEAQRLQDILQQTKQYENTGFRNFIASLGKNTSKITSANQTYGGYYG